MSNVTKADLKEVRQCDHLLKLSLSVQDDQQSESERDKEDAGQERKMTVRHTRRAHW